MNYIETITYPVNGSGNPVSSFNTVSSGTNQGLYAEIVPMTLQVLATRPSGASINITRNVEIALIPVFQFGVFCGYDCSYFPGPNFSFGGRVHTNQNLFLAAGGDLVFNDKISAFQQVIMDQLENGHATTTGYGGTVFVPKATSGCTLNVYPPTGSNCVALPGAGSIPGDASWSGGYPTLAGTKNINFPSLSSGTLNGFVTNSLTGAKNMQLPFVQNSCTSNPPPCTDPISIVRKPQTGESATQHAGHFAPVQQSSNPHPDRRHRCRSASRARSRRHRCPGLPVPNLRATSYALTSGATEFFGWATPGTKGWVNPYTDSGLQNWTATGFPLIGELTSNPTSVAQMNSPTTGGPWIRVEYLDKNAGLGWASPPNGLDSALAASLTPYPQPQAPMLWIPTRF